MIIRRLLNVTLTLIPEAGLPSAGRWHNGAART